ncbi:MAG: 4Fe-4S dicluster domain-containing protein [Elusimicrobia bacterium]|nr:4Fe-4S dicluster domain-containing protein [Elusimicrobiota bacterium]
MKTKYINVRNWQNFLLNQIEKYDVFSLFESAEADRVDYRYLLLTAENLNNTVVGKYRSVIPIKSFFFPPVEKISSIDVKKPKILVGVKACELAHLKLLDAMFLGGEYRDPVYEEERKNTIIISADCTSCKDSCFCSIIQGQPYPTSGFDMNLRPVGDDFVVEILSEKGRELVDKNKQLFQDSLQDHVDESEKNRQTVSELVLKTNKDFKFDKSLNTVVRPQKTDLWKELAKECVECGGCRFSCSTCYCFLIGEMENFEKYRLWDACQFKGYARVAGGGNPKPTKEKRYRNLYSCKFDYRFENFGFYACTGCGRCIEVCPAEIDVREVLSRLDNANKR